MKLEIVRRHAIVENKIGTKIESRQERGVNQPRGLHSREIVNL